MGDTAEIRQLESEGYTFQGCYSWNQTEVKERAAELRKQGNKARVVYEPGSKLSRGHRGGGYSVYWKESEANIAARLEDDRLREIARLEHEEVKLREATITRLNEIAARLGELKKEGE